MLRPAARAPESGDPDGPPLRIGIIGLGVAATYALPEIVAHPHVKITAGADPRPEARSHFETLFGGETYPDADDLCQSPNVDAVYILTPSRLHAQHAIRAAECKKQVLADKPMALSLEDCEAMVRAAERNGVRLLVGHSQSLDTPILRMAEIVQSGSLGKPLMIQTSLYSDWLYRPRSQEELDSRQGDSVVLRQGPVQVDIVRMLGGGHVERVRAMTTAADASRPIVAGFTAYLEFAGGVPATIAYSGYGYFDSAELTSGIGLSGTSLDPTAHPRSHQWVRELESPSAEWASKDSTRFGGSRAASLAVPLAKDRKHAMFGHTLVSCERGDVRQSPEGLTIYGENGRQEVSIPLGATNLERYTTNELNLMYDAWAQDRSLATHDGHWGMATTEVCLAVEQSARERKEVFTTHQVAYPMGGSNDRKTGNAMRANLKRRNRC